jgi:hypothetical protein
MIIKNSGGPMGIGLLFLPISLFINIFLISALLTFKNNLGKSILLMVINIFGVLVAAGISLLIITNQS